MQKILGPGKVYFHYGPVQMTIMAQRRNQLLSREVNKAGAIIPDLLKSLVQVLPLAKQPWPRLLGIKRFPRILRLMFEAVSATQDETLTPMASVAGAFADLVADFLIGQKATKVIVNNGGDIAVRLKAGENIRVGIAPRAGGVAPSHFIALDSSWNVGGVATSGMGGRSFTLGIADAAVAVAKNAAWADACATLIANNTNVDSPLIKRRLAREIDSDTDIPDLWVTTEVGDLPEKAIQEALARGLAKVKCLVNEKVIVGGMIILAGRIITWPEGLARLLKR
jgi:ApbE superfamily uncharacterized protein (UPF0280 family)